MKDVVKNMVCIAMLFVLNVLTSYGTPQDASGEGSFLDFEILDEQNKTCRLKKCVLNKPMKVVLPETAIISGHKYKLTTVGSGAFSKYGCNRNNLTHIVMPSTVTTIENGAFSNCDSLVQIIFSDNLNTIGQRAFFDCDGLVEVTFPNSVVRIESYAFSHCDKLTTVTLPESVEVLEEYAFGVSPLSQVFIPKSVKVIGIRSFDCNLAVDNENPNFSSEDGALFDKKRSKLLSLPVDRQTYSVPKSVVSIEEGAFCATNIKEVEIPNSVISIGKEAFINCFHLCSVVIPNSVEVIGDSAFFNCLSLKQATLSNNMKAISNGLFENCGILTTIEIPNSVTSIGTRAFRRSGLSFISFPDSIVKIGDGAFDDCYNLNQVSLPNSIREIGRFAFYNCVNLKQITIPSFAQSIGVRAFPEKCKVVSE